MKKKADQPTSDKAREEIFNPAELEVEALKAMNRIKTKKSGGTGSDEVGKEPPEDIKPDHGG